MWHASLSVKRGTRRNSQTTLYLGQWRNVAVDLQALTAGFHLFVGYMKITFHFLQVQISSALQVHAYLKSTIGSCFFVNSREMQIAVMTVEAHRFVQTARGMHFSLHSAVIHKSAVVFLGSSAASDTTQLLKKKRLRFHLHIMKHTQACGTNRPLQICLISVSKSVIMDDRATFFT